MPSGMEYWSNGVMEYWVELRNEGIMGFRDSLNFAIPEFLNW
jgi:hypothetical protein